VQPPIYIPLPLPLPLTLSLDRFHFHFPFHLIVTFARKKPSENHRNTEKIFKKSVKKKTQEISIFIKTMAVTIKIVKARQIFDSRGNPTVEVSFLFFLFFFVFCLEAEKMSGKMKEKLYFIL